MSFWCECASFGYMPKSGNAGFWGRLIARFLGNWNTDLHSSCKSLHSCQKLRSVTLSLHVLRHKLSSVFYILAILRLFWWDFPVSICTPFFKAGLFGILRPGFLSSLYILEISTLSTAELVKSFSRSIESCFTLLNCFVALQMLLGFRRSHFLILALCAYVKGAPSLILGLCLKLILGLYFRPNSETTLRTFFIHSRVSNFSCLYIFLC